MDCYDFVPCFFFPFHISAGSKTQIWLSDLYLLMKKTILALALVAGLTSFAEKSYASIIASWTNDQAGQAGYNQGVTLYGAAADVALRPVPLEVMYNASQQYVVPSSIACSYTDGTAIGSASASSSFTSTWDGSTFNATIGTYANLPSNSLYSSDFPVSSGVAEGHANFSLFFTLDTSYDVTAFVTPTSSSTVQYIYGGNGVADNTPLDLQGALVNVSGGTVSGGSSSALLNSWGVNYTFNLQPGTYNLNGQGASELFYINNLYGVSSGSGYISLSFAAVPEPSTYALFGIGALILAAALRRKKTRDAAIL